VNNARRIVLLVAATAATAADAHAQGENHWYNQFGDHSFLLGGAVIGGVSDLGAVFYNPGRLARIENPSLFLHTRSFQRVSVTVDAVGGEGDLTVTDYGTSPGFSAGAFTLPFWPNHRWGYSYLTRRNRETSLDLSARVVGGLPGTTPPGESLTLAVDLDSRLVEDWFGISWSTIVSSSVSLGVSAFGTRVSRAQGFHFDARASVDDVTAALIGTRRYELSAWGLLLKGGLAVTRGPLEVGLTATTPQLQLDGSGKTRFEDLIVGFDVSGDGLPDDGSVFDRQAGLSTTIRTPAAIGLGVAWRGRRAVVHVSSEWYSGRARHALLESEPIVDASGAPLGRIRVVAQTEPVINVGAGLEWHFSPAFSAYAGIRTDASPAGGGTGDTTEDIEVGTGHLVSDVLHFGGGVSAETRWFVITTGLTHAAGERSVTPTLGLDRVGNGTELVPVTTSTLRLLIGLSIQPGFLDG